MTDPSSHLADLWRDLDGAPEALSAVTLGGADPVLPSSFHVGTAAAVPIAAVALAARELDRRRTGRAQTVAIDMRDAAVECRSERHLRIDGSAPAELWDDLAGAYPCGDGRYVRLHTNFPHHRDGIVALLGCAPDRADVAAALQGWQAEAFEAAATEAGLVVAAMRSFAEWDAHPHSPVIAAQPLVRLTRIGEAPPRSWPAGARPLSGLRVMELTRIIAGPVAGRALAAHGAEVLRLLGPGVPTIDALDIDSGRGKRSAWLDLSATAGQAQARQLAAGADVLLQSYRPGALAARGLAPADLARLRPGIVVGSLSAYGESGPWGGKRGFDSLVQTATGFNAAEAEAAGGDQPRPLPLQILDHASGYLLAWGILMALLRQADEGGSWQVAVSLARTGHWLRGLGRVAGGLDCPDLPHGAVGDRLYDADSAFGRLTAVRHAATLSRTPPAWTAPEPYGSSPACWAKPD